MRQIFRSILRVIAVAAGLSLLGLTFALYYGGRWSVFSTSEKSAHKANEPTRDTMAGQLDPSIRSVWLNAQNERYSEILKAKVCDTLVVPFQSQHLGFDRATRSLMTAQLAISLAAQSGRCVVDPYLASDALGDGMRRFEPQAIRDLARNIGASKVVTIYVGHDGKFNMEVFARVERPSRKDSRSVQAASHMRWNELAFTDERPPFIIWQEKLPEIMAALDLGESTQSLQDSKATELIELPDAPEQLVMLPRKDRLDDALRYELLAMLGPEPSFRSTERLFEKAWLAATLAPNTPESRRVRARALMHLGYRPAAIAELGDDKSAAGQALRSMLDGNLPEAEVAVSKISAETEALIAAIELRDLRLRYKGSQTGETVSDEIAAAMARSKSWNALLSPRSNQYEYWQVGNNLLLKGILESLYPIEGYSVDEISSAAALLGKDLGELELQLLAQRHIDRLLEKQPERFCCASFALLPSELDFLQLVSARSMFNLERHVYRLLRLQGRIEEALSLLDDLDSEYPGHPHFASLRANALLELVVAGRAPNNSDYSQRAHTEARKADYYEQAATPYSQVARISYGILPPGTPGFVGAYNRDYPPKPLWSPAMEMLRYTSTFPGVAALGNVRPDQVEEAIAALRSRFHGSREAENYIDHLAPSPSRETELSTLHARIEHDPGNWQPYERLAQLLLKNGDSNGVVALIEKYPGFAPGSSENPVGLSNQAAGIADLLFWSGHLDASSKFYELAAGYRTGSSASLLAAQRVSTLEGKFPEAAEFAQSRAMRYQKDKATRDFLMFMFALGFQDQAWPGFMAAAERSKTTELWSAAMVGKRIEGGSDESVADWLASSSVRSIDAAGDAPALSLGMTYFIMDRPVFSGMPDVLARVEGTQLNHLSGATISRPSRDGVGTKSLSRSKLSSDKQEGKLGDLVPAPQVLFAPAYVALRVGDFEGSVKHFVRYANFYAVEGDYSQTDMAVVLPYFAFAAAKTGDKLRLKAFIERLDEDDRQSSGKSYSEFRNNLQFQRNLALAYFAGVEGDVDGALERLQQALIGMYPGEETTMVYSYQYAEACIWLYEETKDVRYRDLGLEWARKYQRMVPTMAWAYALEAAYGSSKDDGHLRAVALALYLDRNSYWLGKVPEADIERARAWLPDNNPFKATVSRSTNAI